MLAIVMGLETWRVGGGGGGGASLERIFTSGRSSGGPPYF